MDEKAKVKPEGQLSVPNPAHGSHLVDWYGGGTYSQLRHIAETIGGSGEFNRDKPTGRLAKRR